jgi:hypothetical protein
MPLHFRTIKQPDFHNPAVRGFLEACRQGDFATVQGSRQLSDDIWLSHGLKEATRGDQPAMMEFLLENGAVIQTWTVEAASSQPAWEVLLKHGLDVNNPMPWAHVPLM